MEMKKGEGGEKKGYEATGKEEAPVQQSEQATETTEESK